MCASRFLLCTPIAYIAQAFLSRLHQVRDVGAGKPFPSNRYWFPSGQGDAAKFLHGKENSVKWESEYGPIYRIWSGPNPEVFVCNAINLISV